MPLKRYVATITDPQLVHIGIVTPLSGTAVAVVGLRIHGGPEGGDVHICTWSQSGGSWNLETDTTYAVAANDCIMVDAREFLEHGSSMTLDGPVGCSVEASCVVQATPSRLPDGYTEVKCLRLNRPNTDAGYEGRQAIDTGVIPSATQKYECVLTRDSRYTLWESKTATYAVFGGKHAKSKGLGAALWVNQSGALNFVFGGPNAETGYSSAAVPVDEYRTVTADMSTGIMTLDGTQIGSATPQAITSTPATIALFGQHNASGPAYSGCAPVKIQSWKAWDNGTLICDLVPCLRDSDSVPGMYDVVGNAFISSTNSMQFDYETL